MAGPTTWRLLLEYDGTAFCGWQRQPEQRSIQSVLEEALWGVLGTPEVRVIASGRTDAGVHAYGQVASFRTEVHRKPSAMRDGLNAALPKDLACLLAQPAHPEFHAIRSATGKLYRYVIRLGEVPSAFRRDRAWQLRYALDLPAMQAALKHVVGTHDFTSFRAAGCAARSPIRRLDQARIRAREDEIWIEFYGAGFLRHMVRNLVGSLMEVGRHKRAPAWFAQLLEARDRQLAGPTAPALGLHLVRVDYPAELLRASAASAS